MKHIIKVTDRGLITLLIVKFLLDELSDVVDDFLFGLLLNVGWVYLLSSRFSRASWISYDRCIRVLCRFCHRRVFALWYRGFILLMKIVWGIPFMHLDHWASSNLLSMPFARPWLLRLLVRFRSLWLQLWGASLWCWWGREPEIPGCIWFELVRDSSGSWKLLLILLLCE